MKIISALKHLFIPHEHNDYTPHFFREVSVAVIVVASLFMLGFSAGSSFLIHKTVLGANISAAVLVDLTNESRIAMNEAPLVRSPVLDQAAELKAKDMVKEEYFAHTSPAGVTPWHWFKEVGYVFLYAGENLAINFTEAKDVQEAWLASPTHRANLLDVKFKEIGMATVSGIYKNDPSIYVVQMFGTPAKALAITNAPRTEPATASSSVAETPKQSESAVRPTATSSLATLAQSPEIKGESSDGDSASKELGTTTIKSPSYEPIITSPDLAVVQNNENVEAVTAQAPVEKYSTWYDRFLFEGSYYVNLAYKVLLALVLVALLTMILIEIRKQHWKHITYGLSLLLVITLCTLINQAFF